MEKFFSIILSAVVVIAVVRFLPVWIVRLTNPSPFKDPETLRREAAKLRSRLSSRQGKRPDRKTAETYEELGSVMSELSLHFVDTEALNEAIVSYRRAAEAYRAAGMDEKCSEVEFNLGAQLCELGGRLINSAEIQEGDQLLAKILAAGKDKWLLRLPLGFCQAARANVLAELGVRLGDEKLFLDALPLCALSRAAEGGAKFKPPVTAADALAGHALTVIGRELADRSVLLDAVDSTRRAMQAKDDKGNRNMLAVSQSNLGIALTTLGEFDRNPEMLEEAAQIFAESLECRSFGEWPVSWAGTMLYKARALTALGRLTRDPAKLSHAIETCGDALDVFSADSAPLPRAETLHALGDAQLALADLRNDPDGATLAAESFLKAEAILQRGDLTGSLARVRRSLAVAVELKGG